MRCWIRKAQAGRIPPSAVVLIPASEHDEAEFAKLNYDIDLRADIVQPRNGKLHRKAFVLLNEVLPHTNYPNLDRLRAAMTIGAGFVDETIDPYTGAVVWYPKSWSFENMDDIAFKELYNALIDVALQIVPNSKRADWEAAVDNIVRM